MLKQYLLDMIRFDSIRPDKIRLSEEIRIERKAEIEALAPAAPCGAFPAFRAGGAWACRAAVRIMRGSCSTLRARRCAGLLNGLQLLRKECRQLDPSRQ